MSLPNNSNTATTGGSSPRRPRAHFIIWGVYSALSLIWLSVEVMILIKHYSEVFASGSQTEAPIVSGPTESPAPTPPGLTPQPTYAYAPDGYEEERKASILRVSGQVLSSCPLFTAAIVLISSQGTLKFTSLWRNVISGLIVVDCVLLTTGQLLLELGREYVVPILPPLILLAFLSSVFSLRNSVSKVAMFLCSGMVIGCFGFYGIRLATQSNRLNAYAEGMFSRNGEYFYMRIATMIWEVYAPLGLMLPLLYRGLVDDFAQLTTSIAGPGAIVRSRSTTPQKSSQTNRLRIRTALVAADCSLLQQSNSGGGSGSSRNTIDSPPKSSSHGTLIVSKDDPSGQATLVSALVDRVSEMMTEGESFEKILAFVKHELWLKQVTQEDLTGSGRQRKVDIVCEDDNNSSEGPISPDDENRRASTLLEIEPTVRTLEALLELITHYQGLEHRNMKQADFQRQGLGATTRMPNTVFASDPVYSMGDHQTNTSGAHNRGTGGWVLMDASESLSERESQIPVDSVVSPRGRVQDRTLLMQNKDVEGNTNTSIFAIPPPPPSKTKDQPLVAIVANPNANTSSAAAESSEAEERSSQLSSIQSSRSSFQSTPTASHQHFPLPVAGGKMLPNEMYRHGSQTVASSNERRITMILLKFNYEGAQQQSQSVGTILSPEPTIPSPLHHRNPEEVALALMQAYTILNTYASRVGAHVISLHGDRYLISFNTSMDSSQPELKAVQLMSRLQDTVKTRDAFANITFQGAICTGLAVVGKSLGAGVGEIFGSSTSGTSRNYYHHQQQQMAAAKAAAMNNENLNSENTSSSAKDQQLFVYASWRPRLDALMHHTQALTRYLNTGSPPLVLLDQETFEATKTNVEARLIDQLTCTALFAQQQQSSSRLLSTSSSMHGLSEADFVSVVDQQNHQPPSPHNQPRHSVTSGPTHRSGSPASVGAGGTSQERLPGGFTLRAINQPLNIVNGTGNTAENGTNNNNLGNSGVSHLDDVSSLGTVLNEIEEQDVGDDRQPILVYELVGNLPLESEGSTTYLEWMYSYAEVEQQRQKEVQQRRINQLSHPRSRSVASNVSSLATPRGRHISTDDVGPTLQNPLAAPSANGGNNPNGSKLTVGSVNRLPSPVPPHHVTAKELPTGSALSAEICYCSGLVFKEQPPQYRTALDRLQRVESQWQSASNGRLISRLLSYISSKLHHHHRTANGSSNLNHYHHGGSSSDSLPASRIVAVASSNDVSFITSQDGAPTDK